MTRKGVKDYINTGLDYPVFFLEGMCVSAWFEFTGLSFVVGVEQRLITASGVLHSGRVMFIRGPSGVGKTTLLRILARLQGATGGEVRLDGRSWHSFTPAEWRAGVCYVAQQPAVFAGTVRDNLQRPFQLAALRQRRGYDEARVAKWMEFLMLPPVLLEQDARLLSGGEAARVAVLRALLVEPSVLLLDEPTAALDQAATAGFCDLLNHWLAEKPQRGVVMISHDDGVADSLRESVFLELKNSSSQ